MTSISGPGPSKPPKVETTPPPAAPAKTEAAAAPAAAVKPGAAPASDQYAKAEAGAVDTKSQQSLTGPPQYDRKELRRTGRSPEVGEIQAAPGGGPAKGRTQDYEVQKGDNLWNITKRYNPGATNAEVSKLVQKTAKDNGIENPDLIHPGQKLKVPAAQAGTLAKLEGDPAYQKLDQSTKDKLYELSTHQGADPAHVQDLAGLATAGGFDKVPAAQQQQMLAALDGRPKDPAFCAELKTLAGSAKFQGLGATDQSALIDGLSKNGSAEAYLKSLDNEKLLKLGDTAGGAGQLAALKDVLKSGGLSAAETEQTKRIDSATFTPGVGLSVVGNDADKKTYVDMVRREMLRSPSFQTLMTTINADSAHPLEVSVGRNQPGHFVDAFNGGGKQTIDLADFEKWPNDIPAGNPDAMTRGQNLVHAMAEARKGALGDGYDASHREAINAENQYRADRGQTSKLRLPPNDTAAGPGGSVVFQFDNGYREQVNVSGGGADITGIDRHNPPTPP